MSQSKLEGALLGLHSRHRLTGPSGSAALQREWLDDVGTVIRTQLAKLREMPKPLDRNLCDRVHICMHHNTHIYICPRHSWEKQATATQRDSVRQLLELLQCDPCTATSSGNSETPEEVVPASASLASVAPTASFGSSLDSQESPTVPEPIVREHSFMEGAENMAIQALQLAMQDSPPSQKLKTAAFQARLGCCFVIFV